jgi:ubiquinone/menaquinone biosynthesis C-methylase UbiE
MPGHVFGAYPHIDMQALPYSDGSFDVVVHSDTLEHVHDPILALAECHRVLCAGGTLCFTVPIIVGRLSRSRDGLPKSYHGDSSVKHDDFVVHTEFGADAWTYAVQAGFQDVRLFSLEYPAAIAVAARKKPV